MADRRMFSKTIIDSDCFLDMPATSQLLYFHLAMRADDDGFINQPKSIMRICGCKEDDMKLLIAKQFVIPFESGVVVIRHWKIHNYIRKDTYRETACKSEKTMLLVDENNAYSLPCDGFVTGSSRVRDETLTQDRIGKDRIGKDRINKEICVEADEEEQPKLTASKQSKPQKHIHGEFRHVMLSSEEYDRLIGGYGEKVTAEYIKKLDEYLENRKDKHYANHNLTIRNWIKKANVPKLSEKKGYGFEGNPWEGM